jgi:hypothetical protein
MAITTMKMSVSPGAVMNGGMWWGASGLADALKLSSLPLICENHEPVLGDMQCRSAVPETHTYFGTQSD